MAISTLQPTRTRRLDAAQPPAETLIATPVRPSTNPTKSAARAGSSRLATVSAVGAICAAVVVFVVQLRHADLGALVANIRPGWVLVAALATGMSLLAAAHSLTAFAPVRLRAADNLRAQLAICALRIVAPSAVSTPAIWTRYLSRSGLSTAQSLAVVGTAQAAQLLMTITGVGALALIGSGGMAPPSPLPLAVGAALLVVIVIVARRMGRVRHAQRTAAEALAEVARHLRDNPFAVLCGLVAAAGLSVAHITAFAACVAAVGGHASILALTGIYLGAASAGSLIPTPGGVGAVEAAMIAGLATTGMAPATAAAAALLTRLLTVWLLVPPGWVAARSMRRRGLL